MNNALIHQVNQLQASLRKMEATLGTIVDAVVWVGDDRQVQWCNAAFAQLVGQPLASLPGMALVAVLPLMQARQAVDPDYYPDIKLRQGTYTPMDYEVLQNDTLRVLEISGNYLQLPDSEPSAVLVLRDVTQLKQLVTEQQQAERELLSVLKGTLESTADGILVVNRERNVPVFNQKFVQMWAVPEALLQPDKGSERLKFLADQTCDPDGFIAKVWELFYDRATETILDYVEMQDGRIFERYSQPQWDGDHIRGRVWSFRDITDRRQSEEALRKALQKLSFHVENSPLAVVEWDRNYCLSRWSSQAEALFGWTAEEVLGKHISEWQLIHPDDADEVQQLIDQLVTGHRSSGIEQNRNLTKDGTVIYCEWYNSVLFDEAGNFESVLCLVLDMTDRKRTELALRRSEAKFRRLFENSLVGIFRTRIEDGLILEANQRYIELTGYASANDVIGRRCSTEFYANLHDRQKLLQELQQHGQCNNYEAQFRRCDGTTFWVICSVRLNTDENCLEGVVTDISRRKQVEDALRRSELKYRNIFENSQVGIFRTRVEDGLVLEANQRAIELAGYQVATEVIGKKSAIEFYTNVHDRQQMLTELQKQGEVTNYEIAFQLPDGSTRCLLYSLRLNAEEHCLDGVVTDISDRKQAENALQQAEERYRSIFENSVAGIFQTTPEGRYLNVNPTLARMHGYDSPEDMMSHLQNIEQQLYVYPERRKAFVQLLQEHDTVTEFESEVYRKDGSIIWISENARIVRDAAGNVLYYEGNSIEITTRQAALRERNSAAEALRLSELKYRNIFETSQAAIFRTHIKDGLIFEANQRFVEFIGYQSIEDVIGKKRTIDFYINPDDRHQLVSELQQKGAVDHFEVQFRQKNGAIRWGLCSVRLNQEENCLEGAIADITDRKRQEEALRLIVEGTAAKTGDEFFRSCVRYLAEALQVRYALVTEFVNETKTRVRPLASWGYTLIVDDYEYDLCNTPAECIARGEVCYYRESIQSYFPNDLDFRGIAAESYLGVPITDCGGNVLGHLAVMDTKPMQDDPGRELIMKIFAARAGAELERMQAEEKFVKAFRSSPSPIAITTLSQERRFIDVNRSFLRMSGYRLEEVIGHTADELNLGVAPDAYKRAIQQALETGSLYNQEFEFRTKSGEVRTVLLSIELIDLAGAPCILNIVNDITERKRLENELISLVSHELRTPMTSLLGALDLLGSGQLGTLTPQGQQVLTIATNNTERLTRLLNDILDLERMKSGKVTMQRVRCNAADLMTQATESMQPMAEKAQVTLQTDPLAVELYADPDRILQTLTNLLSNAVKFSEPGKTVWLTAELRQIQSDSQQDSSDALLMVVQDEGRGIPADKLQLIFDRFQQVDASDSRKKGGTGLGLAICRNIVQQHGGKIWVESLLGQGSKFYIMLPLVQ